MKKKYILLKESPELKKGAIVEEKCEDGGQDYMCIDKKFQKVKDQNTTYYTNKTVETQPEWFQEICQVEVPKEHIVKVEKFIKSL